MHQDIERRSGLPPEEVFASLGHETRLAILYALWEARDPEEHIPKQALSFAELRKHVGMKDGSQFNYHLKQLLGRFVHRTEDGYILRRAGERIISTVLAGTLTNDIVYDSVPIEGSCPLCGGVIVFETGTERTLDFFIIRCTACEGAFPAIGRRDGELSGLLSVTDSLPPAGTADRSPEEVYRALQIWIKHQFTMMIEGVCPMCSGTVTVTPLICRDHETEDGTVCKSCNTIWPIRFFHVCNVCHLNVEVPVDRHLLAHPTVQAFYHERGYDLWSHEWLRVSTETIAEQAVVSEDPLAIHVVVVVGDDRLDVTLDGEGTVSDVQS